MKLVLTLAAVAALSACAQLASADKKALADAAVAQIQAINAAGFDPVNLPPEQIAIIQSGCAVIPLIYPDMTDEVSLACVAAMEIAK